MLMVALSLHCAMVMRNVRDMQLSRKHGVSRTMAVHTAPNPKWAEAIAWYIYDMNPKRRTPAAKERELIQRACMSTDANALSER